MEKLKRQAYIFSVILVCGVLLIGFVLFNMRKAHHFKSYVDPQKRFSIKYPPEWSMLLNVKTAEIVFATELENEFDHFKENVNVVIQDLNQNPLTLDEYTEMAINQMKVVFKHNFIIEESVPTSLSGASGHKLVFEGKGLKKTMKYKIVWTIKGNYAYQITYTSMLEDYDKYIDQVNAMFRSFRILKK